MHRRVVNLLPPGTFRLLPLALFFATPLMALQIRNYSAAVNDRLIHFPGAPIYNFQTPAINPTFSPSAALFLGIGWPAHLTDWTRQMALVSPQHFVYAAHYPLGNGWQIAFLGPDGNQHAYGIKSQVAIINSSGQTTDLLLCTLTSAIPSALGITPFPVLNLASEADYTGKTMVVCGSFVRAGKMQLAGFTQLTNDPGFDTTRFAYFDYNPNTGASDNCNYQGGDSGAPSFIMVNGQPAIIGTASGQDPLPNNISRNYLNFIPHYLTELDTLMEAQGYHMKRFYPVSTTLVSQISSSSSLRQMMPGGIALSTQNTGAVMAHNVSVQLTFSSAPNTVSGSGWICEAASPLVWNCRRGGLANAALSTLTANWNSLPNSAYLQFSAIISQDGGTPATVNATLPVLQSFSSWIQGTSNPAKDADPDRDGISNLLEYALGGSPAVPSLFASDGHRLLPQVSKAGSVLLVRFPRRTDAAARGLVSLVQFSTDPTSGWQTVAPAGTTEASAPYSPPSSGFEEVTVSLPVNVAKRFVRVKVTLDE